jgi:hypothetical protein
MVSSLLQRLTSLYVIDDSKNGAFLTCQKSKSLDIQGFPRSVDLQIPDMTPTIKSMKDNYSHPIHERDKDSTGILTWFGQVIPWPPVSYQMIFLSWVLPEDEKDTSLF